mmetsp:Transcript_28799/g.85209  ORF Transcript_28799/g.85209 Transcript_28799/m.85209 type:complete len:221 (+) Transcript_28799:1917-2579(+)
MLASPKRRSMRVPCMKVWRASSVSSAGSSASPQSSSSTGLPVRTQLFSTRMTPPSEALTQRRPLRASITLTHRLAWSCGSIISGQRLPLVTSTALSMLTSSVGRPCTHHSRTSTALDRVACRLNAGDSDSPLLAAAATHAATSSERNSPVNTPAYEMHAADTNTSPTRRPMRSASSSAVACHRTLSSASAPVSLSARVSRFCASSAWYVRLASSSCVCSS